MHSAIARTVLMISLAAAAGARWLLADAKRRGRTSISASSSTVCDCVRDIGTRHSPVASCGSAGSWPSVDGVLGWMSLQPFPRRRFAESVLQKNLLGEFPRGRLLSPIEVGSQGFE